MTVSYFTVQGHYVVGLVCILLAWSILVVFNFWDKWDFFSLYGVTFWDVDFVSPVVPWFRIGRDDADFVRCWVYFIFSI